MNRANEVESFIFKFKQLWRCGYAADLQLNCNAGEAFLNLRVGLGCAISEVKDIKLPKENVTPTQHRRRIRRQIARSKENVDILPTENSVSLEESVNTDVEIMVHNLDASKCTGNNVVAPDDEKSCSDLV